MGEASGDFADSGAPGLPLTPNGVITRAAPSILPADPAAASAEQDKNTHMASRAHNAIWDIAPPPEQTAAYATKDRLTLACWLEPTRIKRGPTLNHQGLIVKGSAYSLTVDMGHNLVAGVSGQTSLQSTLGQLAPGVPAHLVSVFDGPGRTWKLYVNGAVRASRQLPASQTVPWGTSGTLWVGGQAVFGADGVSGRLQNVSILKGIALSDFQVGVGYFYGTAIDGVEGADAVFVYPSDREAVAASDQYRTIRFWNGSDTAIWLARATTATVGGGIYLRPHGGAYTDRGWSGAWHAVHEGRSGAKLLSVRQGS